MFENIPLINIQHTVKPHPYLSSNIFLFTRFFNSFIIHSLFCFAVIHHIGLADETGTFLVNTEFTEDGTITIAVNGPTKSYTFAILQFVACITDIPFCRLNDLREIKDQVHHLPTGFVLGYLNNNEGEPVYYGENGDFLENQAVVYGFCHICVCDKKHLVCNKTSNCEVCPKPIEQVCTGNCSKATLTNKYDKDGLPPDCETSPDSCVPETCTTPVQCPGEWSPWGECKDDCSRYRNRSCDDCPEFCTASNFSTHEWEPCGQCVSTTTPYQCQENEVYEKCVTNQIKCGQPCEAQMKNASCDRTSDDTSCQSSGCICKPYFKRDPSGKCIPVGQCDCWHQDGTPMPQGYTFNLSKCCEFEVSNWTECSKTCGGGIRRRIRNKFGPGTGPECEYEPVDTEECNTEKCPCLFEGENFDHDEKFGDECRTCKCYDGQVTCSNITMEGIITNKDCTEECYCKNGKKECIALNQTKQCLEAFENCNNETHMSIPTDDKCCPACVEKPKICRPETVSNEVLRVNTSDGGECVSEPVQIRQCVGSCGTSTETAVSNTYNTKAHRFELFTQSNCACCKAAVRQKFIEFSCPNDQSKIKIEIDYIASCSCEKCGG
ncbi:unnamed protein product [Candidula unifasciata]|uniref:CTCK domain-containing protein n=1 Tax=Candidula unifasciata TaxID=100452 RepID=A0A8S3YWQ0_9EUPU|nr:unnamed protein product [Candidula unifasciata]